MAGDDQLPDADRVLHRAIDVNAPAEVAYRWLCQMKIAPYSYDWIDNRGRRSPRELTPGAEKLELGQRIAVIFRVTAFDWGTSLTMAVDSWHFGKVVMTYAVDATSATTSRYVGRLRVTYPRGPYGWMLRAGLPAGDLIMMRKQLRTLAELAEGPQLKGKSENES